MDPLFPYQISSEGYNWIEFNWLRVGCNVKLIYVFAVDPCYYDTISVFKHRYNQTRIISSSNCEYL